MRAIGALLMLASATAGSSAQALYKVGLNDRIDRSDAIVEGRVIDQRSLWNEKRTLIYTISRIEPYRVFKGNLNEGPVEIITPGGQVGMEASVVSPALSLREGDVGVFMLENDVKTFGRPLFRAYSSVQGFIRYDEVNATAADPFDHYPDIPVSVRNSIENRVGTSATIIRKYEPIIRESAAAVLSPESGKSAVQAPVVSSVSPSPTTGGTDTEILITGVGFGSFDNGVNSAVFFPNADDGGKTLRGAGKEYVTSWNDTEIRVKVPTASGTGKVTVQNSDKLTGKSTSDLTIDFNRIQISYDGSIYSPDLVNKNGAGGYSVALSSSTAHGGVSFAASPAVAPFEAAIATWQAATGFNISDNGGIAASNTVDPGSPPDIVMFDSDDPNQDEVPLQAGILGRTFQAYNGCGNPPAVWWLSGFDMVFRRSGSGGVTWHFGSDPPPFQEYDFQTVAVHELGHAHQLGHIIAREKVMHYSVRSGDTVRDLDPTSDIAGGFFVLEHKSNLGLCGQQPMVPLVGVSLEENEVPTAAATIESYPNPFFDQTLVRASTPQAESVTIELFDVMGRRLWRRSVGPVGSGLVLEIPIDGTDLVPGVYLLRLAGDTFSESKLITRF